LPSGDAEEQPGITSRLLGDAGLRISRHRERRFRGIVSIDFAAS
jgi:hypothetical protein